jgi:hypothetical protein
MAEADKAWRGLPEIPRPQASRLDARYRAAREGATKRLAQTAVRASQARFDALMAMMELCHERETAQDSGNALAEEQTSALEARWSAVEDIPAAWKPRLEARFREGGTSGENLDDLLLNLEVALGIESPAEVQAARQRLKLLALKTAMEGRQATVTKPADIERWLLDAAATPRPDGVARERMGRIIAAVRRRA